MINFSGILNKKTLSVNLFLTYLCSYRLSGGLQPIEKGAKMRKVFLTILLCGSVAACSGDKSPKVAAVMQKNDKYMNCSEVKLEMNEAEFYDKTARKNEGFHAKYLLMPLGYVSTYMNAEDARQASRERVEYLQSIYDILECDRKQRQMLTGPAGYAAPENNGYGGPIPSGYAPAYTPAPPGGSSYNLQPQPPADIYHMQNYTERQERVFNEPM